MMEPRRGKKVLPDFEAEPVVAAPEVPVAPAMVALVNLSGERAVCVPLKSGLLRVSPKCSETVQVEELTADARRVAAEGRITIRTL